MMTCQSSGEKSSSAVIAARNSRVHAVTAIPGSADGTVILYDNATTGSGTILAEISIKASVVTSETIAFNAPVEAANGIYAALSGTGVKCIVHFSLL